MSARIYVDTNVYLDYFEDRSDGLRPLGEFAFSVFRRALDCEFEIVLSSLVLDELEHNNATDMRFRLLMDSLTKANKLIKVKIERQDRAKAGNRENRNDALHAILANRINCRYLVTRNLNHFLGFSGLVEAVLPEQL